MGMVRDAHRGRLKPLAAHGPSSDPAAAAPSGGERGINAAAFQSPGKAMFDEIMRKFEGSPSQQEVIRLLLERGFSVNDEGRVVSGGIEIPNTGIAREIGVDRRVVDSTTSAILDDEQLRRIFQNISSIPSLMDLAPVLDLSVLTVEVADADAPGIVAEITSRLADRDISIRQTVSEDPEFTDDPKLYLVTDEPVPGDLLNELSGLPFVRRISIA
jgi:hypothetical protein